MVYEVERSGAGDTSHCFQRAAVFVLFAGAALELSVTFYIHL